MIVLVHVIRFSITLFWPVYDCDRIGFSVLVYGFRIVLVYIKSFDVDLWRRSIGDRDNLWAYDMTFGLVCG